MPRLLLVLIPLAIVVAVAIFVQRVPDVVKRALILTWAGRGLVAAFVAVAMLFLIGETASDPGGWKAVGLITAWLVPLVGLSLLAFYRPSIAVSVLAVATLVPVAFGAWAMVDYAGWRGWQDQVGPVSLVLVMVVGAASAVLGRSRPNAAGWLMVVVSVVPVLLAMLGSGSEWGFAASTGLMSASVLTCGLLYLWADRLTAGSGAHSSGQHLVGH